MKIILASQSPRRRELLKQIGFVEESASAETTSAAGGAVSSATTEEPASAASSFCVIPSDVEEKIDPADYAKQLQSGAIYESYGEYVAKTLSSQKAIDIYEKTPFSPYNIIIGADTVVAIDDRILGKPSTEEEAFEMLKLLQGNVHSVYTGVTFVLCKEEASEQIISIAECTEVEFYPMTSSEIESYIETGDCMDKAGAYGIQGYCARYIKGINGDYNNVVGLPVGRIYQFLKERGKL